MSISRLAAGVVALSLAAVGAVSSTALALHPAVPKTEPMLGPNQVTTGDRVPWSLVGDGWYLTIINQGPHGELGITPRHQLLDLVDPLGGRYQMAETSVGRDGSGSRDVVGWSADGRRALVMVSPRSGSPRAVVYDMKAGTHHTVVLGRHVGSVAFGAAGALYFTHYGTGRGADIVTHETDGTTRVLLRRTDGRMLPAPQGRRVVVAPYRRSDHRLEIVDTHGRLLAALPVPGHCAPVRWWGTETVMATCFNPRTSTDRLFAVPVDGSPVTAISARHGKASLDLGDLDARRLDGTTYLEAEGPCGVVFLARQHPDGTATEVDVPGTTENVYLLGTRGHQLVLQAGVSCDGGASRSAITHFDPRAHTDRVIALLPLDEAYQTILAWREPRATLG